MPHSFDDLKYNQLENSNEGNHIDNLALANQILEALGQEFSLNNEDYLYDDEFYLTIIGNIIPENSIDMESGETQKEKAKKIDSLLEYLSHIIELDLSHLSGKGIVIKKDENCVNGFLQLIAQLITVLKNENIDDDNNIDNSNLINASEPNSQQLNDNDLRIDSELLDDINNKNDKASNYNTNNNYKDQVVDDDISKKEKINILNDDLNNPDNEINEENNQNIKSKLNIDELNDEQENNINNNSNLIEKNDRLTETENSYELNIDKQKSLNDMSSLSQIDSKINYSQNDISKYIKQMTLITNSQNILQKEDFTQEDLTEFDNLNNKEKLIIIKELKKKQFLNEEMSKMGINQIQPDISKSIVNISHISEVSKDKENSEALSQNKILNKQASNSFKIKNDSDLNRDNFKINQNFKNNDSNSNIRNNSFLPSKISSIESKTTDILNKEFKSDDKINRKINIENNSFKKSENLNNSNNINKIEEESKIISNKKNSSINEKSQLSNFTKNGSINSKKDNDLIQKRQQEIKVHKNTKTKNDSISMSTVKSINSNHTKNSNIGENKIKKDENQEDNEEQEQSKINSDLFIEELPLNDENLRFEIMKEFKKIYGNNFHRLFLKENLSKSSNTLDLIIRNLKLAKSKMTKLNISNIKDPDDLLTKEFMLKYQKELDYIINFYQKEEKKRQYMKEKAVKCISKNLNVMKKIQEIQENNLKNEIIRRSKSREIKNHHNKIKECNEM